MSFRAKKVMPTPDMKARADAMAIRDFTDANIQTKKQLFKEYIKKFKY